MTQKKEIPKPDIVEKKQFTHKWASQVKEHVIVTQKEGAFLGHITNIFINLKDRKLLAFEIKMNMLGEKLYIGLNDIKSIGEDTIFISEKAAANTFINTINHDNYRSIKELKGSRITTLNGKYLGDLKDIDISTKTFEIVRLSLETGEKMFVKPEDITIGEDEILVPIDYEKKITRIKSKIKSQSLGKDILEGLSKTLHIPKQSKRKSRHTTHV